MGTDPDDHCYAESDIGEDGTYGYEGCPASCGLCAGDDGSACEDSTDWRYKGKSNKDCEWVAKKPDKVGEGWRGGGRPICSSSPPTLDTTRTPSSCSGCSHTRS